MLCCEIKSIELCVVCGVLCFASFVSHVLPHDTTTTKEEGDAEISIVLKT